MNPINAEQVFVDHLASIDRIIASIARRHALHGDDADDFASWVKVRLIDNDYAIVRKYEGRSSLNTYLTVVIANLFRDYRVKEWGRWRPSVAAKRLGPVATKLETLIGRDRLSVEEAFTVLESNDVKVERAELRRLAAQLPTRSRVRRADAAELDREPATERADTQAWVSESDQERARTEEKLAAALKDLAPEDEVILRLRFWDGLSVADISRTLGLEQKPLYRRIERNLGALRGALEREGVSREQVVEFFAAEHVE